MLADQVPSAGENGQSGRAGHIGQPDQTEPEPIADGPHMLVESDRREQQLYVPHMGTGLALRLPGRCGMGARAQGPYNGRAHVSRPDGPG